MATPVFINEFHYDNTGTDVGEFIEIAGPAGTDLTGWSIVLYNGNDGASYSTTTLSGPIPNTTGTGFGFISTNISGIQNGAPDGIALVNSSGQVQQFLSYEGSLTATNGPAQGQTSVDIGVSESGTEAIGLSLQLQGSGVNAQDFTWFAPADDTPGALNVNQTFGTPSFILTIAPNTFAENATNPAATATLTRSDTSVANLQVTLASSDTTEATVPATVSFVGNNATVTFPVTAVDDNTFDGDSGVTITASATGLSSGTATVTVTDNETPVITPISTIQGTRHRSPLEGQSLSTRGIVTEIASNGFYLQDPVGDGNAATSEGIFVFTSSAPSVLVGNSFIVTGVVSEFRPGNNNPNNLTITQVDARASVGGLITSTASLGTINPVSVTPPNRTIETSFTQTLTGIRTVSEIAEIQEPTITPNTSSTGNVNFTLNGSQLVITGSFSNLTSNLLPVGPAFDVAGNPQSAIHVHNAPVGVNGPIIRALTVTSTSPTAGTYSGTFNLTPGEVTEFQTGRLYINLHTVNNPGGELRGQLGPNTELNPGFNPTTDGIDYFESLEGQLVQIVNPVAVSPTNEFGGGAEEIWVLANNGTGATGRTERGGISIAADDFNPERIQIDDFTNSINFPDVNVGATFQTITGVVSYDFNNYEVLTRTATVANPSTLTPESTTLTGSANILTIADYNVENLDPGDANDSSFNVAPFGNNRIAAIGDQIVNNLNSPDILSLAEVQDNNGATNDTVVSSAQTLQAVVDAIVAAGGPTYEFRVINPVDDTSGGEPGGNIRVAFLFNPNRVQFVDRIGGNATTNTTVSNVNGQPILSASPGNLIDTNLADGNAFNSSRNPLVGEFVFNGQQVFVVGNHFNSKGGDQPLFGPTQPPILGSETQRRQQAEVVGNFVEDILTVNANANVVVLGDLNDFEFSAPLEILFDAGLNTLTDRLPEDDRYTFNFQGNSQVLDHLLVSNNLNNRTTGFDIVHLNSEFLDVQNVSDHDPGVAAFNLPPVPGSQVTQRTVSTGTQFVGTNTSQFVFGTPGRDTITGFGGDDQIFADDGNDSIDGGVGNDLIFGQAGNDTLLGSSGDDVLIGGANPDSLTGGSGRDAFVYNSIAEGNDRILDFADGVDFIRVPTSLASVFGSAFGNINAVTDPANRANTLVFVENSTPGFQGGEPILATLSNFQARNFSAADVQFI